MTRGEHLVQVGMLSVIRDIQEYVNEGHYGTLTADGLNAYLLACLVTAGAYEPGPDGEG